MLKIGHEVIVPPSLKGLSAGAEPDIIPIPAELETVPGSAVDQQAVSFYARQYPLEVDDVENYAFMAWFREVSDMKEAFVEHEKAEKPLVKASRESGDLEPDVQPVSDKDVTQEIKAKALELGFSMVGMTAYDNRYTYVSRRKWVKPYPHAICLALEQSFEDTQTAPHEIAEKSVFTAYEVESQASLELADYIRSLGYHCQVQYPNAAAAPVIPMFIQAGMGQLGASGYLLSPHFGSRHRLMIMTTDAPVTYDTPVDYGVNAFCAVCQVCVNRCPGRALMRDRVWWRGVVKYKVMPKRCRPVLARYSACAVCMKVCPVQMYGLKPVMEHYAATGQVLGKGTHALEGYEMRDLGYFGPGELPKFESDFFHIPEGSGEGSLLRELTAKIEAGQVPQGPEGDAVWEEFRSKLETVVAGPKSSIELGWVEDEG